MIIGAVREHHVKVSSTNTVAANKLREGKPAEGTIISADFQGSGRGQRGNRWESEAGKNLLVSIILYPGMITPADQFILSQVASLAVYDLVSRETPEVKIKWPNDIYVRDDKIAGILIENSVMGEQLSNSIIGIGLNVNQKKFGRDLPNPISLTAITGRNYNTEDLLTSLEGYLDARYRMAINGETGQLSGDYHQALYRINEWHSFIDSNGDFRGMIDHVRSDGLLSVKRENGTGMLYAFKEIEYVL